MISFEVDASRRVREMLKNISEEGGNLTIPFMTIAKSWFRSNRSIFSLKGPGKYQDLSEPYKKQKLSKVGFVYPIMKRSGRLEDSLTNPSHSDAINIIANKVALYLGTKVPYAIYHQSSAARRIMPYRPIVFLGVEQVAPTEKRNEYTRILETLDRFYQEVLDKNARLGGGE